MHIHHIGVFIFIKMKDMVAFILMLHGFSYCTKGQINVHFVQIVFLQPEPKFVLKNVEVKGQFSFIVKSLMTSV